jgi:hypothetical protein
MESTVATTADDRDRWMAWAGPAFLVLFLVFMVLGGEDIAEKLTGKEVLDKVDDQKDSMMLGAMLAPLAGAALLLFTARLRSLVRPARAAKHVLLAGAVLYASSFAITAVVDLALASAAEEKQEGAAAALNLLDNATWLPVTMGAGLTLLGAGLASLRAAALPAWLAWIGIVGGVISLLGPGGFVGYFLGPLWVGAAGVVLATRRPLVAAAPVV